MTTNRIFLTGRIAQGQIHWNLAPLPADGTLDAMIQVGRRDVLWYEEQEKEVEEFVRLTNKQFDQPALGSFFDHLSVRPPTPSELYERGRSAQRAGRPLAALEDEYAQAGWWAAYSKFGKYDDSDCVVPF